jgi:hypothetical protein
MSDILTQFEIAEILGLTLISQDPENLSDDTPPPDPVAKRLEKQLLALLNKSHGMDFSESVPAASSDPVSLSPDLQKSFPGLNEKMRRLAREVLLDKLSTEDDE